MRQVLSAVGLYVQFVLALSPAMAGSPREQYDSAFGQEAQKVAASVSKQDDAAFADKLLAAAVKATDAPASQALLCEKAYEFGLAHPDGHSAAESALRLLEQLAPDRRGEIQQKLLDLCEQRLKTARGEAKITAQRKLISQLLSMGEADLEAGKTADAAARYRRAHGLARSFKSADADAIGVKADRAAAQDAADRQAEALAKSLAAKPDAALARKLLMLHLTERDDPVEAAKLLAQADADESLRSYLPLAARPWTELNEAQCLELARWYEHEAGKTSSPLGRPRMLQRAKAYFESYATLHGKQDMAAAQATQAAERLGKLLDKSGGPQPGGFEGPPEGLSADLLPWLKVRDALPAKDQPEAIRKKLSEVNGNAAIILRASKIEGEELTELDLHDNKALKSIGPLHGLKLRGLVLKDTGVTSLRILRGMKLERLDIGECPGLSSLDGLEGMPLVDLYAGHLPLTSLLPLRGTRLKRLELTHSPKLTSLEGLEGLPLENVTVSYCASLHSIEALRGAPVVRLNLTHSSNVDGFGVLTGMPLRDLDVMALSNVASLESVRGAKLVKLNLTSCSKISDLAPLAGMPLEELSVANTRVSRLLPLRGMPLRRVDLEHCLVLRSLDGIEGLPLASLTLTDTKFANDKVAAELKKRIPTLTTVKIRKD